MNFLVNSIEIFIILSLSGLKSNISLAEELLKMFLYQFKGGNYALKIIFGIKSWIKRKNCLERLILKNFYTKNIDFI